RDLADADCRSPGHRLAQRRADPPAYGCRGARRAATGPDRPPAAPTQADGRGRGAAAERAGIQRLATSVVRRGADRGGKPPARDSAVQVAEIAPGPGPL